LKNAATTFKKITENKNQKFFLETPACINLLTRKDCTNIFSIRARIIKIKANYKNAHNNMQWCEEKEETQEHILSECPALGK